MKFKAGTRRRALEYEKDWAGRWKADQTFEKSVEQRPEGNSWVFYDGPPFLTGTPHHGHLLVSTVKDAMGRFHTMKGQRVERRWGWDCHGLPAEVYVEKQLGIANKREIGTKISVAEYVRKCREAMVKTGTEWEDTIERLGRWVEFEGAYKTMDKEYMESVWWAFKELHTKGKIYEGEKILIYCTKDATPISKSEVAMENSYQLDTDPSVFVYFRLEPAGDDAGAAATAKTAAGGGGADAGSRALPGAKPEREARPAAGGRPAVGASADEYLLAWTTTPWTLPANVAVAVHQDLEYSLLEHAGKRFYVASEAVSRVMQDAKKQPLEYTVLRQVRGRELVGRRYEPLFENRGPNAHRVLHADFVTDTEGTGIVHEAPAYGEDDYELARAQNVPVVSLVDADGNYTEGRWQGENIWEINKTVAKTLVDEGRALKVEYVTHEYPHCHRCGGKLMYRAHPSWFMDIQGQKAEMLAANGGTKWVPDGLRTGRFHNIIEQAPDWNLSRDRYWATPIPVWKGVRTDGTEVVKVFGGYDEFEQFTGKRLSDYHLPEVMNLTFELDGTEMRHIGKVLDCWFESGSMPFAQFHYPFENKAKFERMFPADFIIEAIDQTRGWFYSLLAVNVGLFGRAPWKNLICTGFINAADGKKMSKKLKNYTDPMELMDKFSADSFRFLMLSSPLTNGENLALADKDVGDVARKLGMVWNMYDFFTMYAAVDGWEYDGTLADPLALSAGAAAGGKAGAGSGRAGAAAGQKPVTNPLDVWVVSRLHQLVAAVEERTEAYDLQGALRPVLPFIDDASNWYVRRSRRRFWRAAQSGPDAGGDDADKNDAYRTLHYVLVRLAYVLAPFTPYLAEELHAQLTGDKESVHLKDWLPAGTVDETVVREMAEIRRGIESGLSQRAAHKLKVRQPLQSATVYMSKPPETDAAAGHYTQIIKEELNVHQANLAEAQTKGQPGVLHETELDFEITPELKREGLMRELVRQIQTARKAAGLNVDDRIALSVVSAEKDVVQALEEHAAAIKAETLATALNEHEITAAQYTEDLTVDGHPVRISLAKAQGKAAPAARR